ncbi:T9SS type A sorting domain-containing protein [Adhaeribacter sp. BT258]|uniref:T9SS type A sorting domain-containing protein n=1 Tax=Adhaeribacter terrigena TaxID=2793070 RepID=A0ABS1C4S5_9BACT|nr:T9SS type A sorting domain-containing protein [Adhaeribacter terrigena]MBK0404372.1 T9SS type A sorting domain-containing protein [Adhaeribacter terrigena]
MKKIFTLLCFLVLVLGAENLKAANATVTVGSGGSNTFSPQQVNINVGDMVTWQWASGTHDVTSATGAWSPAPITSSSPSFSRTFTTAGTYSYFCSIHGQSMSGTVVVAAAPTGMKDDQLQKTLLHVYPNPALHKVQLELNLDNTDDYEVRLTNAIGKTVKTIGTAELKAVKKTEIDLSGMAGGIYFYTLWNKDKMVETRRLVILK